MEIQFDLADKPFNLDYTLGCGQVFRWFRSMEWWYGIIGKTIVRVRQASDRLIVQSFSENKEAKLVFSEYFGLDENLKEILSRIDKDGEIHNAIQKYNGLRIIRQDPWECLISFICATNTNISNIQRMIQNICQRYGNTIFYKRKKYYSFPTPDILAKAKIEDIQKCGLGYRAKYIISVSNKIASNPTLLEELEQYDYHAAKNSLVGKELGNKIFKGVGAKVADCILLFSLNKTIAFPIDIWIIRTIIEHYSHLYDVGFISRIKEKVYTKKGSISIKEYNLLQKKMVEYFGEFSGYAQEYLYLHTRNKVLS